MAVDLTTLTRICVSSKRDDVTNQEVNRLIAIVDDKLEQSCRPQTGDHVELLSPRDILILGFRSFFNIVHKSWKQSSLLFSEVFMFEHTILEAL